ncbi:MAG: xylulokinase [Kiritimatiellia bacterium]|nr:xylulokinase [Kiritimatiellia bacterium]
MKQLKKRVSEKPRLRRRPSLQRGFAKGELRRGEHGELFLGLDLSTQALKAIIIDSAGRVRFEMAVNFDRDLPEFKTQGGVHQHADGLTVTSPALMWVAALDLLLERLKSQKIPLDRIAAISGSGQQHGSVYLRHGTSAVFNSLDPKKSLKTQLAKVFSVENSPVWMDSSTARECRKRDAVLGGPEAVAKLTGSRSYERFTGNQIAKIAGQFPAQYAATEHIALVSSFLASLLIGGYAPIDTADGSGMNLMNIFTKQWDQRALDCSGGGLAEKLGPLTTPHKPIGQISSYYTIRYGFSPATVIIACSGDNPNSLAAFGLERPGAAAISLGTSDTIFGALANPKPSATEGHIFGNPINPQGYMALVCWKNGSLTREFIRDSYARGSWDTFNSLLSKTPPGNDGLVGFYFKEPEITPPVFQPGTYLFDKNNKKATNVAAEQNVRAILESQCLSMRLHCGNIGLKPKTIIATGGASVNISLLRIIADVFGQNVYTIDRQNSASLGAALRARHGWKCLQAGKFIPFNKAIAFMEKPELKAKPNPANHKIYTGLLPRYRRLERIVARSPVNR